MFLSIEFFIFLNFHLLLQLNEVLMPNPFNRPRAVFMLEVKGVEGRITWLESSCSAEFLKFCVLLGSKYNIIVHADSQPRIDLDNLNSGTVYRSDIVIGSNEANIHLPG